MIIKNAIILECMVKQKFFKQITDNFYFIFNMGTANIARTANRFPSTVLDPDGQRTYQKCLKEFYNWLKTRVSTESGREIDGVIQAIKISEKATSKLIGRNALHRARGVMLQLENIKTVQSIMGFMQHPSYLKKLKNSPSDVEGPATSKNCEQV